MDRQNLASDELFYLLFSYFSFDPLPMSPISDKTSVDRRLEIYKKLMVGTLRLETLRKLVAECG